MDSLLNQEAPDFTATAVMPNNTLKDITLSDYKNKKNVLLFFYPLDFTESNPSEMQTFDEYVSEFDKRDCEIIGVSVDSPFTHLAYKNTTVEEGGIGDIHFPLVADLSKNISKKYNVLCDNSFSMHEMFLIDKRGIVKEANYY
ncbi:MAG: redoxin domain-containing protein [Bacteriovoracaceae bacterium]|nr:redoxin domain-containing protein [Bacteriovoracaceae bacterium]